MSKGQKSNRELKKPKQVKPKPAAGTSTFLNPKADTFPGKKK